MTTTPLALVADSLEGAECHQAAGGGQKGHHAVKETGLNGSLTDRGD